MAIHQRRLHSCSSWIISLHYLSSFSVLILILVLLRDISGDLPGNLEHAWKKRLLGEYWERSWVNPFQEEEAAATSKEKR